MTDRLIALARRIERQPWNRPGTDKTWVLNAMWNQIQFSREIRRVPHDRQR
ncbi:MAG: hypothetical protein R3F21_24800 [Myxococcota bacterium]